MRKVQLILGLLVVLLTSTVHADELAGEWTLTIDTPRGVQHPTLTVVQVGATYSGSYSGARGVLDIEAIAFDGSQFSFPLVLNMPIGRSEVTYRGKVAGNQMTGQVENARGKVPFSGARSAP